MTVQPGLCRTWSETQIVGFLMHRLNWFQVFISVIDKNDNAPICTKDLYEYSVIGTKSIGQLKDSVKATDADEGSNGDIFYTMSPQTDRNGRCKFEPSRERTNNVVSERVRHKSGCTVTETG